MATSRLGELFCLTVGRNQYTAVSSVIERSKNAESGRFCDVKSKIAAQIGQLKHCLPHPRSLTANLFL